MTIEEVVRDYMRETVNPLTPDQARIEALLGNVDRARQALQAARDQQRQRRESERRAKASQARAAITTSLKA
jgi:DNA-binding phage protein